MVRAIRKHSAPRKNNNKCRVPERVRRRLHRPTPALLDNSGAAPAPIAVATASAPARVEFCVVTCVVTLQSLSVSRAVGCSRSDTSKGSGHASDPHEHCPFFITRVLLLSLGYSRR
jgi:hypothetical protein